MNLSELLDGITVIKHNVNLDLKIDYIASDHRRAYENSVFVAIKGTKRDGSEYIGEALKTGAVAIVTDSIENCKMNVPYILVKNSRSALAYMWWNFYKKPTKNIRTVAITGTNGKTSSAYFLYNILMESGISCGLISTIDCLINGERIETSGGGSVTDISSAMTTPDPETLYYLYNKMKEKNVEVTVIEASSHALEQRRLDPIDIEIGAFTNLSREHLDYHRSIEGYFGAKKKLFEKSKEAVVNIDDKYGKILMEEYSAYGFSAKEATDFHAKNISCSINGCNYEMVSKQGEKQISTQIIGEFTVYNSLLAAACAELLGVEREKIQKGIEKTVSIKGRLEKYRGKPIYIDYAHTPEAMRKVIEAIRRIEPKKRLIVMFGCGGDRDKGKRAEMGRISTALADLTVITSDNSRTENPLEILLDIMKGVSSKNEFVLIPDRKEAIKYIAGILSENDIVLLLGKGHEEYEITQRGKEKFNEREILDEVFMLD